MDGRKFQIGNVSLFIVEKGLFLSVYVDDIKLAGKCKGCDIVQSDHAPQAGVAQGSSMENSSGAELDIR